MRQPLGPVLLAAAACNGLDGLTGAGTLPVPSDASASADRMTVDAADAPRDASAADARASSYREEVMADGPLMYLRLGDGPGATQLKDETGRIQPLVIGAPVFGVAGAIAGDPDTAVDLSNGAIDCGAAFDFAGAQPFSIEAWVKVDLPTLEPRYVARKERLVDAGPDALSPDMFGVHLVDTNFIFARRAAGVLGAINPAVMPSTEFRHYVAVFTGTSLLGYIDGIVRETFPASSPLGSMDGHFFVGARNATSGFLNGVLDEVAVYDKALPRDRVGAHYRMGLGARDR